MSEAPQDSGCTVKPVIAAKPRTISVNGVEISREAIARETQNHPASKPIEAWQAAARALVVRELLLQEARRIALEPQPICDEDGRRETEEEALVRGLIACEIVTPKADNATCRRYYEQNRRRFTSPTLHEVSHILLPHDGPDLELTAATILTALRGDPAAFEALARLHSVCPSKDTGGNLGQIGPDQTVPEFEGGTSRAARWSGRSCAGPNTLRPSRRQGGAPYRWARTAFRDGSRAHRRMVGREGSAHGHPAVHLDPGRQGEHRWHRDRRQSIAPRPIGGQIAARRLTQPSRKRGHRRRGVAGAWRHCPVSPRRGHGGRT